MPKEEKKEDEKLTPVGDGIETSEDEKAKAPEEAEDDEKVGHSADEDGDEEEKAESGEDPERQKIRERRRKEKQRRQQRIAGDRRELDYLRARNEDLERRFSHVVLRQDKQEEMAVDSRIGQLESQIREAETIHAQAVDAKDGETATEALRVRDALRDSLKNLKGGKETRAKEREERTEQKPGADPQAVRLGASWLENNGWFDPQLRDDDSYIVRALEERMAREGRLNPATPEYWEELDRRVQAKLPHLKKESPKKKEDDDLDWEEDDEAPKKPEKKKPSGPRIAVGGKTRSLKPNEVFISAERKKALVEAGIWDDEERRERYLQSYKRYDEEAARNS